MPCLSSIVAASPPPARLLTAPRRLPRAARLGLAGARIKAVAEAGTPLLTLLTAVHITTADAPAGCPSGPRRGRAVWRDRSSRRNQFGSWIGPLTARLAHEVSPPARSRRRAPHRRGHEDQRWYHHSGHRQGEAHAGRGHRRRARRPRRAGAARAPRRQEGRAGAVRQVVGHGSEDRWRGAPHYEGERHPRRDRGKGLGPRRGLIARWPGLGTFARALFHFSQGQTKGV